jgi:hypothetical protein
MGEVVATLDTMGWVEDTAHKADRLLSYFMVSEHSQSVVHKGRVKSFPYILNKNAGDLLQLRSDVNDALQSILSAHFDEASVQIEVKEIVNDDGKPTGKVDIKIMAIVTENGVKHSLGRLCHSINGKVKELIDLKAIY